MNKKTNYRRGFMALLLAFIFAGSMLTSCNSKKEETKKGGFNLAGSVEGINEGKIRAYIYFEGDFKTLDTLEVKDGKFTMNYDFPVADELTLEQIGGEWFARFYAENGNMTINGKLGQREYTVTGGEFQAGADHYKKANQEYFKTHKHPYSFSSLIYQAKTEKEKQKLRDEEKQSKLDFKDFLKSYIKENPTNPYCAQIVWVRLTSKTGGESAAVLKEWADPIASETRKNPFVAKMFKMLNTMLATEAGLEEFVAGVHNVKYKVDKSYTGANHKNVVYLSMMNNDNLCALVSDFGVHDNYNDRSMDGKKKQAKNFFVQIIDPKGKEINRFSVKAKGLASSIAVDADNNIYVLATLQEEVEVNFRGRKSKQVRNVGVECLVLNEKGEQLKRFELEGRQYATGARIYKDKLLVSDVGKNALGIYNKEDGKLQSTIKDLRPCCSILDFDVDEKRGQILAANLGSFRVDGYELSGKKVVSFGKRGRSLDDFHSCCNPVSVRRLANGAVITVEKSPTRIKVYSEEGAKMIEGIEELVQGCFHIPVMSDSKSNIYLASPGKGLVKCVAI